MPFASRDLTALSIAVTCLSHVTSLLSASDVTSHTIAAGCSSHLTHPVNFVSDIIHPSISATPYCATSYSAVPVCNFATFLILAAVPL